MSKYFVTKLLVAVGKASVGGAAYGAGYAIETIKDEGKYYADKLHSTAPVQYAQSRYYDGKNDAREAFDIRVGKREYKAAQKAAKKDLESATEELMDDFDFYADNVEIVDNID